MDFDWTSTHSLGLLLLDWLLYYSDQGNVSYTGRYPDGSPYGPDFELNF